MTEAEWLACKDPDAMLKALKGRCSDRKLWLFAVASFHRVPALEQAIANAMEVTERYADGQATLEEIAVYNTTVSAQGSAEHSVSYSQRMTKGRQKRREEAKARADLLREIFGNPHRPVTFAAEWRTDTAVALARQMYEAREFSAMPILADALQDAGCDNTDILNHCRDLQQTHVRGCWVVDLVLGKQ